MYTTEPPYRFVTLTTYARLAGIQRSTVYKRLKRGSLQLSPLCESPMIDLNIFPPTRHRYRPKPLPEPNLPF